LSFGPRRDRGARWPGGRGTRGGWIAIIMIAILLAGMGTAVYLALVVARQDHTIAGLRADLRSTARRTQAAAASGLSGVSGVSGLSGVSGSGPVLPVDAGTAVFTLPKAGGPLSVVAAAVRPRPGSAALTWLFIYDLHADPGARYGLLEGTCGGQYVTASDLADGTADRQGDLTIVAPNLAISSQAADVWILVYRWVDGVTIGGIQGPLVGGGAKTFRTTPPC
jgi:hypothetical protein